jgi:integrase
MSYLPDRTTEAEKVEPIERRPGKPNIYTPVQMRALLEHVNPQFLPWLAIAGFAGVRSEEIAPDPLSKKSPLDWSDIIWKLRVIRIRSETSKTREEREVPLSRNLMEWLAPYKKESGPVCEGRPTNYETGRLGAFIGGWKHNALRDTYCSYRARIVRNLHQVCYEMGTSLAMAKRSYHRSQPLAPAKAYFSIRSERPGNVIKFPKNRVPKSSKKRPSTAVIRASR